MKEILFSPFDLGKWFVLGFTAFLAMLTDLGGNGGGGSQFRGDDGSWECGSRDSFGDLSNIIPEAIGALLLITLVIVGLLLFVLFLWLSSRGHFMYLDNVVHNRSRVKEPWARFGRLGTSLFVWRIVYTLICLLAIGPLIALGVISILPLVLDDVPGGISIITIGAWGVGVLFFILVAAYVDFFLLHLVVPIMYKHDITTNEAWRKFRPILKERIGSFILYGIFYFLLNVVLAIVIFVFGLMTCCVGFLLLIIPYIGTVVLLPVHVTFRGMDLEFLGQFGDDVNLVPLFPALPSEGEEANAP